MFLCFYVFLSFCFTVFLSFCLSVFLFFQFFFLQFFSVFWSFCLSVVMPVCLSSRSLGLSVFLSFCPYFFLSLLSVFLFFCLSALLSLCLAVLLSYFFLSFVCLSASFSSFLSVFLYLYLANRETSSIILLFYNQVDCETDPEPVLVVVATDNGVPRRSATATVRIGIKDVNDNEPKFDKTFYNVTLRETEKPGTCFLR